MGEAAETECVVLCRETENIVSLRWDDGASEDIVLVARTLNKQR